MTFFTNTKAAGITALLHAFFGILTIIIVLGSIGIAPSPEKLAEIARNNPQPIILLDILKVLLNSTSLVLVVVLYRRLRSKSLPMLKWGSLAGVLSVLCLLINAAISLFLVLFASNPKFFAPEKIPVLQMAIVLFAITSE